MMRWIRCIGPELRYRIVGLLFRLGLIDWYLPFSPLGFEQAVSDKVKPLFPGEGHKATGSTMHTLMAKLIRDNADLHASLRE